MMKSLGHKLSAGNLTWHSAFIPKLLPVWAIKSPSVVCSTVASHTLRFIQTCRGEKYLPLVTAACTENQQKECGRCCCISQCILITLTSLRTGLLDSSSLFSNAAGEQQDKLGGRSVIKLVFYVKETTQALLREAVAEATSPPIRGCVM